MTHATTQKREEGGLTLKDDLISRKAVSEAGSYVAWRDVLNKWISVKVRLPDAAGVPVLVTAVNTYGQKDVFEAFMGYGDFKWYTENVMRMSKKTDISCEVREAWTITHWMVKPEPAEEQ